jgi:nucleoside-diphosphate-sugar epimerase
MAKYIITGGSSFIGVALSELLISLGHQVVVVCRKSSGTVGNIPQSERLNVVYYNDISDIGSLPSLTGQGDVFIHLAWAGTSHEGRHDARLQESNIKYSTEAVHVAKALGCKLFLDAGSQAEYGYTDGYITEESPCFPENEYGKAKLKFGRLAAKLCGELGLKHIHLRIMSIYGDTDHLWTLVMSSVRKMLNNEDVELSDCTQKWNFVYIKDAVKQMYLLCEHALNNGKFKSEIYHIASHDTRVLKDFVMEMYKLTNSKSKLLFGAYNPANVVSLYPSVSKTEKATGGFIASYTFAEVVEKIILNYKTGVYDESK